MTNDAPAQVSVEAAARVIYEAMGFSFAGRPINARGEASGGWRMALEAAKAVLSLPPPTVGAEDEAVAWLITNRASGNKDLAFEPLADLPFNRERFDCEPLVYATRPAPAADGQRVKALREIYEWYDRDGSVGGASEVFEKHRASLATDKEG